LRQFFFKNNFNFFAKIFKIKKMGKFLAAIFFVNFFCSEIFAENFLQCEHEIAADEFFLKNEFCARSRPAEILMGAIDKIDDATGENAEKNICENFECGEISSFVGEIECFDRTIVDQIFCDNRSNPNFIAQKAALELRKHKKCLQNLCQKIFKNCSVKNLSDKKATEQILWCDEMVEKIFELQKTKIFVAAVENQSRKERTFLAQKMAGIAARFQIFFHEILPLVISEMENFVEKVPDGELEKFPQSE